MAVEDENQQLDKTSLGRLFDRFLGIQNPVEKAYFVLLTSFCLDFKLWKSTGISMMNNQVSLPEMRQIYEGQSGGKFIKRDSWKKIRLICS